MYFDTHAHLDDEQFDAIRDEVLQRARQAAVTTVITIGTTADTSAKSIELANHYDTVYAAVGVQPNYCEQMQRGDWDRIVEMAKQDRVVALGETGLDRHWDYTPFEIQQDYFARHLELAQTLDLPVVIHMRECGQDILQMLREACQRGPMRGVMHSFSGTAELAAEFVALGMYISFAGMVTYRKSDDLRQVAAGVLPDRLLIETDCPYLSPHPKRGHRPNEPAMIVHTAACLAEVRGIDLEALAQLTTENARQLFRVP